LQVKVFDNHDFGYYKVNIERPKRLKSQFTQEALETLRFDKSMFQPMESLYNTYGMQVYEGLEAHAAAIQKLSDSENWGLNKKQVQKLLEPSTWQKPREVYESAHALWECLGDDVYMDFNAFSTLVDEVVKKEKLGIGAAEKKAILNAISLYDAEAAKVIKKTEKLQGEKLEQLLERLGCTEAQLPAYGYYPGDKKSEYITYETESDLRDAEQIQLDDKIYDYFVREVLPHVAEAWINLESVKIGYEISFNKYFYQHVPLRSIEEVKAELLSLEQQADGLLQEILNF